jgi:hypothetical protein
MSAILLSFFLHYLPPPTLPFIPLHSLLHIYFSCILFVLSFYISLILFVSVYYLFSLSIAVSSLNVSVFLVKAETCGALTPTVTRTFCETVPRCMSASCCSLCNKCTQIHRPTYTRLALHRNASFMVTLTFQRTLTFAYIQ